MERETGIEGKGKEKTQKGRPTEGGRERKRASKGYR